MCKMFPTSTQGCTGALGCLEDAWETGGESDTFVIVYFRDGDV